MQYRLTHDVTSRGIVGRERSRVQTGVYNERWGLVRHRRWGHHVSYKEYTAEGEGPLYSDTFYATHALPDGSVVTFLGRCGSVTVTPGAPSEIVLPLLEVYGRVFPNPKAKGYKIMPRSVSQSGLK